MKTKILTLLKQTDDFLSGQWLSQQFGVSRTAIWKVINQLREEGYEIDSVKNRGYRLLSVPDILSESEIKSRLHTKKIAQKVLYFDQLSSTNVFCKQHGEEYPDGTLIVANNQTAGRGSRGRSWESPKDVSIYMSLLLKPDIEPQAAPKLTPVMALSIARALDSMGITVGIKWPNDIVINGKKLVGILTEMNAEMNYIHHIVIGAGINVLSEEFPSELAERATSLLLETGRRLSRAEIIARITECFEEDYEIFLKTADLGGLLEEYKRYSVTIGREVHVIERGSGYDGKALDIDRDGMLYVEKEDKSVVKVFADEVSVRGLYGYV